MDYADIGDPYVEWNEEISAREPLTELEENNMDDRAMENLKDAVILKLMTVHEFSAEDAEEAVSESIINNSDLWHENSDAEQLAKHLASDGDDD